MTHDKPLDLGNLDGDGRHISLMAVEEDRRSRTSGWNWLDLFIYLLMYVFIFHVNQENWWLQVSSKHFFFLPQEQIISHCQFWDGLKLRTSQRNCGPAAFGLFLCFILGCWNGKGICKDLQASTSVPVCSDCWTNMTSPLRSLRPKTPFQNVRSKILNITEAKK